MNDSLRKPSVLSDQHNLYGFDCGEPSLNNWLVEKARYNQAEGYSQTFVIADFNWNVVSYACLAGGMIDRDEVPRSARTGQAPKQIPVAILGRLAVHLNSRGLRLGERMLQHMISTVLTAGSMVAFRAIIVDALNDKARSFYIRYGFEPTKISVNRLLLPVQKVIQSL
jgi:ribosomal protein S18 acetylase RimI-like enzyme